MRANSSSRSDSGDTRKILFGSMCVSVRQRLQRVLQWQWHEEKGQNQSQSWTADAYTPISPRLIHPRSLSLAHTLCSFLRSFTRLQFLEQKDEDEA